MNVESQAAQSQFSEDGVAMFDMVVGIYQRRRFLIFTVLTISVTLAVLYYFMATEIYESQVQVLVMRKDSSLPTQGVESQGGFEHKMYEDLLATHMEIMRSPRVVRNALKQRDLESLPSLQLAIAADEDPVEYVIDNLSLSRGGEGQASGAHVLVVSFRHTSAEDAAEILGAVVESYQDFLAETFQDAGSEALDLIGQAKVELAEELDRKEQDFRQFLASSPLLWSGEQIANVHQGRWASYETALAAVRLRITETQTRIDVIKEALASGEMENYSDLQRLAFLDDRHVERLALLVNVEKGDANSEEFQSAQPVRVETARTEHDQLLTLRMKEKTLLVDYGAGHPEVQEARQRIQEIEKFLEKSSSELQTPQGSRLDPEELLGAYVELLEHDIVDLKRRETELVRMSEAELVSAKTLVENQRTGETLSSDIDRKKELYDAVVDRLREVNLVTEYGGYITEVMSPPDVGDKVHPKLPLVVIGGLLAGTFLGFAGALVLDFADKSFRDPDEIVQAIGHPLMGHIWKLDESEGHSADSPIDPTLLAYHDPKSRASEAFRGLRTSLYFNTHDGDLKLIQVTSATQSEGKSTIVANMAVSVAQAGKKVVLVDCDLRRPRVHQLFGCDNTRGLSSLIVGEANLSEIVQDTDVENMSIIPSGPIPPNPAELLETPQFQDFLGSIKAAYDFVFIDSPPVLAVSEAAWISAHVDGVLLVVRVKKNDRPAVLRARDVLLSSSANILGIAVNGVERHRHISYGYGYGGYTYGDYAYGGEAGAGYYGD